MGILHAPYDTALGHLFFQFGRVCESMLRLETETSKSKDRQPLTFSNILAALDSVAQSHLELLPFEALRIVRNQRRCVLKISTVSEVSLSLFLSNIGAQTFRSASSQFKFCLGPESEQ